jgi:hypothetical protein
MAARRVQGPEMKCAMPRLAMSVALASALVVTWGASAAVAAAPRAGDGWSIQAVPSPSGASDVALNGISCHAHKLCIAVGGSSLGTLAEEWNGTAWSIQTTPSPTSEDVLNSVSCVSATACEAVGSSSTGAVAEAWNGTSWTAQPTPALGGASLAGVWCVSAARCVAVGRNGNGPIAEGWNGRRWARQRGLPPPHPPSMRPVALNGVWCSSARSCTAAGYAFDIPGPPLLATATWNGKRWTWPGNAVAGLLNGISCSKEVCVAVGQTAAPVPRPHVPGPLSLINPGNDGGTVVLPRNPKGASDGDVYSVSCPSAVCEAVGSTSLGTLAEAWNGTKWSLQSTPNPVAGPGLLAGVACLSARACIAVGSANGAPLAEAYAR